MSFRPSRIKSPVFKSTLPRPRHVEDSDVALPVEGNLGSASGKEIDRSFNAEYSREESVNRLIFIAAGVLVYGRALPCSISASLCVSHAAGSG